MPRLSFLALVLYFTGFLTLVNAYPSQDQSKREDYIRPSFTSLQVYTRTKRQGTVQHMLHTTENKSTTPCWNLQYRHIGSFEINDPWTKVVFYRSNHCLGAPLVSFQDARGTKNLKMAKARSVSIIRLRPLRLQSSPIKTHHRLNFQG